MVCGEKIETERVETASTRASLAMDEPVSRASRALFAEDLLNGSKPASDWQCGLELEVIGYEARALKRLDATQVQRVLMSFAQSDDDLVLEDGILIEAQFNRDGRITVEPGGQIEFSGAAHKSLIEVEHGAQRFIERLRAVAEENNYLFIAAGFDPVRSLAEQQWFPKPRYAVMRPYLAGRGARALDMMARTCAIQVNLDYGAESDLAKKYLLGTRLAPIVTAMFANSPFEDGRLSGYKSTRALVWLDTDNDRTAACVTTQFNSLIEEFSVESFVDYALDVPMIFARRDGQYTSAPAGVRFCEFLDSSVGGLQPIFADWRDHLTTIFTDARLKQHIELRSADGGNLQMAMALQALWKGLMYDEGSLDDALRIAPALDANEANLLRRAVARDGLVTRTAGVDVLSIAKETIKIAARGLEQLAPDEARYLDVLREQVIEDETSPADKLIHNWRGRWHETMRTAIEYLRVA